MSPFILLFSLLSAETSETSVALDVLRFENGDISHGHYLGLDEGPILRWQSPEAAAPIAYEIKNVRKLIFNETTYKNTLLAPGTVNLVNGDKLVGDVLALGSDSLTLQTEYAGLLTIPRKAVISVSPNLPGGPALYAGPYSEKGWTILPLPAEQKEPHQHGDGKPAWVLAGGNWYSNGTQPLCLDAKLPDEVSIRFHAAWQNQFNIVIALYADFKLPVFEEKGQDNDAKKEKKDAPAENAPPKLVDLLEVGGAGNYPQTYGSAYILNLHPSFSRLNRTFFNESGEQTTTYQSAGSNMRLNNLDEADFEIRFNRLKGTLILFINGDQVSEWTGLNDDSAYGSHLAFATVNNCRLRLSDMVISPWNGMPDSARSMLSSERDVLLLTNGTDRISGKLLTLEEDVFRIETEYSTFHIPITDVETIHFATNTVQHDEAWEITDKQARIYQRPRGKLTLLPHSGQNQAISGSHPILGDLKIDLNSTYLIEFDPTATIFDNWDENF